MKKSPIPTLLSIILVCALTACAAKEAPSGTRFAADKSATGTTAGVTKQTSPANSEPRTLTYLNKTYTVKAPTDKIVIAGAMESMEDALVLGVQPIGAITTGGKFPELFKPITSSSQSVGEKMQPNMEAILKLKPDVILGSTKFPAEASEKLAKLGPMIPVSHIATNWEDNLRLIGELTGKQAQAEQILKKYKEDVSSAKTQIGEKWKGKKIVTVRIRTGSLFIYPADVFLNPTIYGELGFAVPEEVKAAKAQQNISLEQFSAMNPDAVFLQFSEDENMEQLNALKDLQKNPIWLSTNAAKNNKIFVNVVDPLAQGGASWSKINFLKAAVEKLSN
ncbi:ABC transporter substrate-binding protein [Paenibacillus sp. RC67]|uniref:ABC transporter substrate-binding protein n=1 Tax=Paenibacillus sp. RC67 TaxID=3039392 RepID=UPI0024AE591C|nr:ABC transporter substrate-binding protein [Paenibacillus sp. RC67]